MFRFICCGRERDRDIIKQGKTESNEMEKRAKEKSENGDLSAGNCKKDFKVF